MPLQMFITNTKRNGPWSDWWTWKSPERKIRFGIFGGASRRRGALLNKNSLLERLLPCQYKFRWWVSFRHRYFCRGPHDLARGPPSISRRCRNSEVLGENDHLTLHA